MVKLVDLGYHVFNYIFNADLESSLFRAFELCSFGAIFCQKERNYEYDVSR